MSLHRYLLVVIYGVLIASRAVSGDEVTRAVGEKVSFKLDEIDSPVSSFTWKHVKPGLIVKAIEWEEGEETSTPNPRFQGITTLNTTTGEITIINLTVEHSGIYTIEVSGRPQEQRFTLTVMNRVPKPVIAVEQINSDVVYLSCKNYDGTITWSNSAGEKLAYQSSNESITVQKNGNLESSYTCTFKNAVSEQTSDPVYKKDLFQDESTGGHWWIAVIVILLLVIGIFIAVYILNQKFREHVHAKCPFIKGRSPARQNGIDKGSENRRLESQDQTPVETGKDEEDISFSDQPKTN